jgi:hypothetical protein
MKKNVKNRREFLTGMIRGAMATVMVGGIGTLILRKSSGCPDLPICTQCGYYNDCDLPRALKTRQAERMRRDGRLGQ